MIRLPVENPFPGAPIYFKKKTGSTMEDARRLFLTGCPDGTVVLTAFQERGRGRMTDRSWSAEEGKNLLFTVVLRAPGGVGETGGAPQRLPLIAGLALAMSVEGLYSLPVQLKWPNDILVEGKKVAGILCEALAEGQSLGVLIGFGVNCNQVSFPENLEQKAISLSRILGRDVDPLVILRELLKVLRATLDDSNWKNKVEQRLYGLGREVILQSPQSAGSLREERGVIRGLNNDGSLLFQSAGTLEVISLYSGEIRFISDESS
jgi:BirA family biotin operon repressor/biotin-[acetyl-CoA-carboxylase] ligase